MRRSAVITAIAFCCTLFTVSVAVPAFGGPDAMSAAAVSKRVTSALNHSRRADARALRAYRRATRALRELHRKPSVRVETLAGPPGPPGPAGTPARDDGIIHAKVIYRALSSSSPQLILNTGVFGLRAMCDGTGRETIQYITNVDHAIFSMSSGGVVVNKPDFHTGTAGNATNPGTGAGTLTYTEPGTAGGSDGQTVSMTFTANDASSVDTDTSATTPPFGGTTQVACEFDGIVEVAP